MTIEEERKIIKCKAAICWEPNKPMTIETITVDPPKAGEVRVKVIANSICHSDLHVFDGHTKDGRRKIEFPCILGHEMTGIVESIGKGVTEVEVGDYVASVFHQNCRECEQCKSTKTNLCSNKFFGDSRMADRTSRFHFNGRDVYTFLGIGGLSKYTVICYTQIVKINQKAEMDKVCLFSCGFLTGYGSTVNVAKVKKGSSVGIWGLGTIGLAAISGARDSGAAKIVGIDVIDDKWNIAKKLGCTHFINPLKCNLVEEVKRLTAGDGLDVAIECVGQTKTVEDALECVAPWGTVVNVGVASGGETMKISPNIFLSGKTLTGAIFGGYKSKDAIQFFVDEHVRGKIDIENFISANVKLEDVNDAFGWLSQGKVLRTVVVF